MESMSSYLMNIAKMSNGEILLSFFERQKVFRNIKNSCTYSSEDRKKTYAYSDRINFLCGQELSM